jgi:hypothetical protein
MTVFCSFYLDSFRPHRTCSVQRPKQKQGEDGYVRIARGQGKGGVCGLERAPSVALGGVLVGKHGLDKDRNYATGPSNTKNYDMRQSSLRQYSGNDSMADKPALAMCCVRMGLDTDSTCVQVATWFPQHKPLCFGLSAMICFAMALWLLAIGGRRAQRRRQLRRASDSSSATSMHVQEQKLSQASLSQRETFYLLDDATTHPSYTVPIA